MDRYTFLAYKEAMKAYKKKEIPVGAVIVKNNKVIAKSRNNRQKRYNLLGHAEINCIVKAEKKLKDWRLDGCEMYVTLEPCDMCKFHIKEARIKKVHYLVSSSKQEQKDPLFEQTNGCNTLFEEYKRMLKSFFCNLRK
ncbi:MAG: nucleoside deaminase [Firmicutes bacterium]|nr:nucleoside deaminase [Bacillota bacterium]